MKLELSGCDVTWVVIMPMDIWWWFFKVLRLHLKFHLKVYWKISESFNFPTLNIHHWSTAPRHTKCISLSTAMCLCSFVSQFTFSIFCWTTALLSTRSSYHKTGSTWYKTFYGVCGSFCFACWVFFVMLLENFLGMHFIIVCNFPFLYVSLWWMHTLNTPVATFPFAILFFYWLQLWTLCCIEFEQTQHC